MPTADIQETNTLPSSVNAVFQRKKWWFAAFVLLGGVGDAIKDHFKDKAVDFTIAKLGAFGDFLTTNPFALTSVALAVALLVLTVMVVSESSKEVPSLIYEHRDKPFMKPPAARRWQVLSFVVVMVLLIFVVCLGTYAYWLHIHRQSSSAAQPAAPAPTPGISSRSQQIARASDLGSGKHVNHINKSKSSVQPPTPSPQTQNQPQQVVAISRMTEADRERLSTVLHQFSDTLDAMTAVGYRANSEFGTVNRGIQDGSIIRDYSMYITTLRSIGSSSEELAKSFLAHREAGDWLYYSEQAQFVFGDNPGNLGPNSITNAVEGLANSLEQWSSLKDRENKSALALLSLPQTESQRYLKTFFDWKTDCTTRLQQLRSWLH